MRGGPRGALGREGVCSAGACATAHSSRSAENSGSIGRTSRSGSSSGGTSRATRTSVEKTSQNPQDRASRKALRVDMLPYCMAFRRGSESTVRRQRQEGKQPLSASYRFCSAGWLKEGCATVSGKPVTVEIVETVKRGGRRCRFNVKLIAWRAAPSLTSPVPVA